MFIHKKSSDVDRFVDTHKSQLLAQGVPEALWKSCASDIISKDFSAGQFVELVYCEDEEGAVSSGLSLMASKDMPQESVVFLIDHYWTFLSLEDGLAAFRSVPKLRETVLTLLNITVEHEQGQGLEEDLGDKLKEQVAMYSVSSGKETGVQVD